MAALMLGFHYFSISDNPIKSWLYPFIYAAGLSLAFLIISDKTITAVERQRIMVLSRDSIILIRRNSTTWADGIIRRIFSALCFLTKLIT